MVLACRLPIVRAGIRTGSRIVITTIDATTIRGIPMDFSDISSAVTSLNAAVALGRAALGLRDFNQSAAKLSELNEALIKAQQGLLAHNTALLTFQEEYLKTTKELAEAKEALAEKGSYVLFELVPGSFAYRADARPVGTAPGNPSAAEPEHYICQPCFDGPERRKAVLRLHPTTQYTIGWWHCPVCNTDIKLPGQAQPINARRGGGGPNSWMGS
jgi:hypothetical protein